MKKICKSCGWDLSEIEKDFSEMIGRDICTECAKELTK